MELVDKMLKGDDRSLSRLITLVENDAPEVPEIMSRIYSRFLKPRAEPSSPNCCRCENMRRRLGTIQAILVKLLRKLLSCIKTRCC